MLHYEPCLAVVGAISDQDGLIYTHIVPKSIKTNEFLNFLTGVREKVDSKEFVLVLDNASIHRTHLVQDYCNSHGIEIAFNVP